jgi:acetyltransferase-like isoleucine patch superfamily enzyme
VNFKSPQLMQILHKAFFKLRSWIYIWLSSPLRKMFLSLLGLSIGKSHLPRCEFTWPHKVRIGSNCKIEPGVVFHFDGPWMPGKSIVLGNWIFVGRATEFNICKSIRIGDYALIASGCKFIDHDHGITDDSLPIGLQPGEEREIVIEGNVWLGANVIVLKGVTIGEGAVVAAGAVVTKSVPPFEIWAGVPAVRIAVRPRKAEGDAPS